MRHPTRTPSGSRSAGPTQAVFLPIERTGHGPCHSRPTRFQRGRPGSAASQSRPGEAIHAWKCNRQRTRKTREGRTGAAEPEPEPTGTRGLDNQEGRASRWLATQQKNHVEELRARTADNRDRGNRLRRQWTHGANRTRPSRRTNHTDGNGSGGTRNGGDSVRILRGHRTRKGPRKGPEHLLLRRRRAKRNESQVPMAERGRRPTAQRGLGQSHIRRRNNRNRGTRERLVRTTNEEVEFRVTTITEILTSTLQGTMELVEVPSRRPGATDHPCAV